MSTSRKRPDLLALALSITAEYEEMAAKLIQVYDEFCTTVRSNGLEQTFQSPQATIEISWSPADVEWQPDGTDKRNICFTNPEGDYYFMPQAYLQDPQAWLQGALAAHSQAVADGATKAAQARAARKDMLLKALEELEAQE